MYFSILHWYYSVQIYDFIPIQKTKISYLCINVILLNMKILWIDLISSTCTASTSYRQ